MNAMIATEKRHISYNIYDLFIKNFIFRDFYVSKMLK